MKPPWIYWPIWLVFPSSQNNVSWCNVTLSDGGHELIHFESSGWRVERPRSFFQQSGRFPQEWLFLGHKWVNIGSVPQEVHMKMDRCLKWLPNHLFEVQQWSNTDRPPAQATLADPPVLAVAVLFLQTCTVRLRGFVHQLNGARATPQKISIEPENDGSEDVFPLPGACILRFHVNLPGCHYWLCITVSQESMTSCKNDHSLYHWYPGEQWQQELTWWNPDWFL